MINAEAIKALQEGEVSSDSTSGSTSSDSADELTDLKEEVRAPLLPRRPNYCSISHDALCSV